MSQNTTAMQRGAGGETTGATDMTTQQPEALRLAEILEGGYSLAWLYEHGGYEVSAELRRQHARITALEAQLESIRAGGVNSPLMGQPQAMPDLSQLTERGAKAWAGVDAQALREGGASPSANAGEPMFWVRLCGDGLYEGPIHNARIEEVRKQSGVWSPLYLAAPPTAQAGGWTKASEQLPPCRDDQFYIGINTAGFAGVFNAVRVVNGNTYCLMEVAEESVSIMSDLDIWKPFNPPTSAEGVEHG